MNTPATTTIKTCHLRSISLPPLDLGYGLDLRCASGVDSRCGVDPVTV